MKMKRFIILLLACMLLTLSACSFSKDEGEETKSSRKDAESVLYDKGLELAEVMNEMASNADFRKVMFSSVLDDTIAALANDGYENCSAVYQISISDTQLREYVELLGFETDGPSDRLLEQLYGAAYSNITASLITKDGGSMALAAASSLSASSVFVCKKLKEPTMYVYVYENHYPLTVCFYPGEDGAVSAKASYFLVEELKEAEEAEFADALAEQFELILLDAEIRKMEN